MMRYSVQPRALIIVKGYGLLSLAKNMSKNIGKNISENLSGKYSQKRFDHTKKSAADAFTTALEKAFQKTAKTTGDLLVNKILQQNNSETVTNNDDKEIPKNIYLQKKVRKLLMKYK